MTQDKPTRAELLERGIPAEMIDRVESLEAEYGLPLWAINLKRRRLEQSLSQEQLGLLFGVTKMSVSKWERAVTEPPAAVLVWLITGETYE